MKVAIVLYRFSKVDRKFRFLLRKNLYALNFLKDTLVLLLGMLVIIYFVLSGIAFSSFKELFFR